MIAAAPELPLGELAERLAKQAETLAAAHAEAALLARRRNPSRWRRADLVWPLFPKG